MSSNVFGHILKLIFTLIRQQNRNTGESISSKNQIIMTFG